MAKVNKILLIDDDQIDNYINKRIISTLNLTDELVLKYNGIEAFDYLNQLVQGKQEFPTLIFLDIRMPQCDGFEFLAKFETLPEEHKKQSNIFMLSSSTNPDDIDRAKDNPIVKDFYSKPLNAEMVNLALQKIGVS